MNLNLVERPYPCVVKEQIKVAGMSFDRYIAKRLSKDGIGFVPCKNRLESKTDYQNYIMAPVPRNPLDFLAYSHELGHIKSKQPAQRRTSAMGIYFSCWCNGRIECEFNAWVWGIKYFKRIGFNFTEECKNLVEECLGTYCANAEDVDFCKKQAKMFLEKTGIEVKIKDRLYSCTKDLNLTLNGTGFSLESFTFDKMPVIKRKVKPILEAPKPKNWKPWHDLKNNQIKKQWRRGK